MSLRRGMMAGGGGGGGGGSDPNFSSVVALLHFDGADASTTFTDVKGKTWTPVGDAQIDTAQSKFGGASGLFDGAGDVIHAASSADFDLLGGSLTVEFFFRATNNTANQCLIQFHTATNNRANISIASGNILFYTETPVGGSTKISTTAPAAGAWHHCALVKSGSTFTLYVDGSSVGTSATLDYPSGSAMAASIGGNHIASASYFNGHIDDVRVTKGVARYTSNFTPTTSAFPNA